MSDYFLVLPEDFDEYAWEVEAKGWFADVKVNVDNRVYKLNIYDSKRLSQEIDDEILSNGSFFEGNLVVVKTVCRKNIEDAVAKLFYSGNISNLAPEE